VPLYTWAYVVRSLQRVNDILATLAVSNLISVNTSRATSLGSARPSAACSARPPSPLNVYRAENRMTVHFGDEYECSSPDRLSASGGGQFAQKPISWKCFIISKDCDCTLLFEL